MLVLESFCPRVQHRRPRQRLAAPGCPGVLLLWLWAAPTTFLPAPSIHALSGSPDISQAGWGLHTRGPTYMSGHGHPSLCQVRKEGHCFKGDSLFLWVLS